MGNNVKNIWFGPGQVSLWDSSNKELHLGYLMPEDFQLTQEALVHKIVSGNHRQYGTRTEFICNLLQTDPTLLKAIKDRRDTKQDLFIIGANHVIKLHDIYVSIARERSYEPGVPHSAILSAFTDVETDVEEIKNLLSSVHDSVDYGNFNTDTNTDGLCDGWAELGSPTTTTNGTSFLGAGYGGDQEIDGTGADGIYCDIICPLNQVPIKLTASVYIQDDGSLLEDNVYIEIRTKENDGTLVDTLTSSELTFTSSPVRYSYSVEFTPGANVEKVSMYIYLPTSKTAGIFVDNAQLEIGNLTDYTEND